MADEGVQDLLGLDRDVARATTALAQWRATLAGAPGGDDDPFDGQRRVASRSTCELLAALSPSVADEPLRAALRRWVVALVQARLSLIDDRAWAQASLARSGHFEGALPRIVSWHEAWRGAVAAKTPAEAALWLAATAEIGPTLTPATRLRAARRLEVARRMGLSHPWEPLVGPAGPASLRASARRFLERTDDLSRFVWGELLGNEAGPAHVLHAAVGRDAGDGWPARLTPRWLEEQFGAGVRGLPLTLPPLPQALGAASFARALAMFGHAFRLASAPAGMPFALAREPAFVGAHRLASVFGALAADTDFQLKNLGVGRRAAHAQIRIVARTALLDARLGAARIVLGDDGGARDHFDDIGARLFGAPLDGRLHAAWPVARDDEPARWVGLLQAPSLGASLRATFDTDWFRNPRAWAHLRSQGAGPAHEPVDDAALDAGGDALVRSFEEALG